MNLRPEYAHWFELITTREDLTDALSALADTGSVQLETRSETHERFKLDGLQEGLQEWNQLARRYQRFLPDADFTLDSEHTKPRQRLGRALDTLRRWESAIAKRAAQSDRLISEINDQTLLNEFLQQKTALSLDYSLLGDSGKSIAVRLFVLPPQSHITAIPASVISQHSRSREHDFFLAVGSREEIERLTTDLSSIKGRPIALPRHLPAKAEEAAQAVTRQLQQAKQQKADIESEIADITERHNVAQALGQIRRLEWLLTHVDSLPASENFAWVTGWSNEADAALLNAALKTAGVDGLVHYPATPTGLTPPVLMQNPEWAKPFEIFARMLGTPSHDEADPSRLLVFLAPLLFGYMFADVGQGFVLFLAGLLLQSRWPVLRILLINGLSAMAFGVVFGSVFGREDWLPALWLHPIEHPLPVLAAPLLGGILILLLGLALGALAAHWRGDWKRWLQTDAAAILLYVSIIAAFFVERIWPLSAMALAWYFIGHFLQASDKKLLAITFAAGELLESTLQLLINTLSFVRVGAFALAHAGLSMAVVSLADSVSSLIASVVIMILGNVVIILLEGLVVSIQTTRLILFEFFIRFLQGSGRLFQPLPPPLASHSTRRDS